MYGILGYENFKKLKGESKTSTCSKKNKQNDDVVGHCTESTDWHPRSRLDIKLKVEI